VWPFPSAVFSAGGTRSMVCVPPREPAHLTTRKGTSFSYEKEVPFAAAAPVETMALSRSWRCLRLG
jgi:hypothetical protein